MNSNLEKNIQKLIDDDAAMQNRTWSHYKKLKDENLEKFLSQKVQKEMEAAAQYLGEKFADGDF